MLVRCHECLHVIRVRGDEDRTLLEGAANDVSVSNIGLVIAPKPLADLFRAPLIERVANRPSEQPRQQRRSWTASPSLGQHRRRHKNR